MTTTDDFRDAATKHFGRSRKIVWTVFGSGLMQTDYDFFWCLKCHGRYKRTRGAAWKLALQPEDDCFYWLWSPRRWLRTRFNQIDKNAHAAD